MAETFGDLGLRQELVDAADDAGWDSPTALQRDAVPVLRRGGNVVLHASPGSGKTAAYGLALLDRLIEEQVPPADGPRPAVLVLASNAAAAARTAASLAGFARTVDRRAAALATGWSRGADGADLLVAAPDAALREVQGARLKLGSLHAVVLDDAASIMELDADDALETLLASSPADAQRVLVSARFPDAVDDFVERHVRKALRIPSRPATGRDADVEPVGSLGYAVAVEADKPVVAAELITARDGARPPVVYCRTRARAERLADALELRGFRVGDDGDARVAASGESDDTAAYPISYDVPADEETLSARHEPGGIVLVEPRELPHLRQIAAAAALELRAEEPPAAPAVRADVRAYRERLRQAARTEDLGAQLLLLEPLLAEFSAAELAAATSALLRRKAPDAGVAGPAAAQPAAARPAAAAPDSAPQAWVRLFMSVGERDDVRPGDLVGAITGEANVSGDEIGHIDIRDTFSIVEVGRGIAKRVIETMNGITVKGRSLRVDYDRKTGRRGRRGG